ncbi:MAG TPA: hypothetical protein VE734_01865 [Terriglobales bacterium]|jgi:hypothetical protein|nr:hypothetical protein [Terriglobales bacterium]
MAEPATKARGDQPNAGHIPITEEMDSAKWTLPPLMPVVIVVAALAVIVGMAAYLLRAKPGASGAIAGVYAAELSDKSSTMVLLQVKVSNIGNKPLWVRNIKAQLKTDQGEWTDDAASPVDFARYFRAFPALAQHQTAPLKPETKIDPGSQTEGMVLVSFPVAQDAFDKRKSLTVTLENYDRRPMVIAEKQDSGVRNR